MQVKQTRKTAISRITLSLGLGVASFFFAWAFAAQADSASLSISPSAGTFPLDSVFNVAIKLNSGEQAINSTEGSLVFDNSKLEVQEISTANSILSLWFPAEPDFSNQAGTINFSGGLPSPGFKGANATVISIKFKAKAVGDAQLSFVTGSILANDGKGSNILTSMGSANFKISPAVQPPEESSGQSAEGNADKPEGNESEAGDQGEEPGTELDTTIIRSATHPNQNSWYSAKNIDLEWSLPAGAEGVSYLFDNKINSDPKEKSEGLFGSKRFENIEDGVWYFHLKIKDRGSWTSTYHFRIMIDSQPPKLLEVRVEEKEPGEWPVIFFNSEDEGSGVVRYELKVSSLEEKGYTVTPPENSIEAKYLSIGEHTALVKAVDQAGNEIYAETTFVVKPIETPLFDKFPLEAQSNDQLYFAGKTLPDVAVNVYIENSAGKVQILEASSDSSGNWHLIFENGLANGRYVAWAEAVNRNGVASYPSEKASFLISPPVFVRLGNIVINYFMVFASLLFMIILIVSSIIFLAYFVRKRLRKETFEIEKVLDEKLSSLKNEVDSEFSRLAGITDPGGLKSERLKARKRIDDKIDSAEKKIMKEVKDVEDIVK